MTQDKTPQYLRIDERNHVEKPFLDQLDEIIDLDKKRTMWTPCVEFLPEIS